jgi:hypothetical protein
MKEKEVERLAKLIQVHREAVLAEWRLKSGICPLRKTWKRLF